jgi:hypothetical protein
MKQFYWITAGAAWLLGAGSFLSMLVSLVLNIQGWLVESYGWMLLAFLGVIIAGMLAMLASSIADTISRRENYDW